MSPPRYQVVILEPYAGSIVTVYDDTFLYDLRYSRALNDIGVLAMTLPSTEQVRAAFTLDTFIEVYRTDRSDEFQLEETYVTRLTHRFIEGDEEQFVVGGVSLNHLIARRLIDPDDDPLIAGGYSTKSGPADQVIYDYCNEQMGPGASILRQTPGLTLAPVAGMGWPVGARLRHENLFSQVQSLARSGAVDFQVVRTAGYSLELRIGVIGLDKTRSSNAPYARPWVGLSPQRGNLTAPSLLSDRKEEANYIYALGQGQRDQRIVYKTGGDGITDSPFNRIEFAEDIRNVEKSDVLALITGAQAVLREKRLKREFTYEPTGQEPGNIYRYDWDLGDAITIDWDESELDLRIVNVEVSINKEGEVIESTVSDAFIFPGTLPPQEINLPTRATIWPADFLVTAGLAWQTAYNALQEHFEIAYNLAAADGDTVTSSCLLAAGSYTLGFLGFTGAFGGKIDWYLDDTLIISGQDWYTGPNNYNVYKTATVLVAGDGYHVLKGVVNGKNGASLGYVVYLTKIGFTQAVD